MTDPTDDLLRWEVGDVTVTRVVERVTPIPAAYLLPDITEEHVSAQRPWIGPFFAEDGALLLSVHSFVVVSEGRTIVVDTCAGVHEGRRLDGDAGFLDRLDTAVDGGVAAVDVVVCTHLHFDHIGWNTVRDEHGGWVPAFPSARYLVTERELDDFGDEDGVAAHSLDPLVRAGLVDRVALDHRITGEVALLPTVGHTPGHVSVLIRSAGSAALITGDAVHSPIQFTHPEIAARRADHDSEMSTATRHELIARFADVDVLVLGTHFAAPTAGRVRTAESGSVWFDTGPAAATG